MPGQSCRSFEAGLLPSIADRLVELEVVEAISADTVGRVQRNELKPWQRSMWCIPPEHDAAFVAAMEQVMDVYQHSYDPLRPVAFTQSVTDATRRLRED